MDDLPCCRKFSDSITDVDECVVDLPCDRTGSESESEESVTFAVAEIEEAVNNFCRYHFRYSRAL